MLFLFDEPERERERKAGFANSPKNIIGLPNLEMHLVLRFYFASESFSIIMNRDLICALCESAFIYRTELFRPPIHQPLCTVLMKAALKETPWNKSQYCGDIGRLESKARFLN